VAGAELVVEVLGFVEVVGGPDGWILSPLGRHGGSHLCQYDGLIWDRGSATVAPGLVSPADALCLLASFISHLLLRRVARYPEEAKLRAVGGYMLGSCYLEGAWHTWHLVTRAISPIQRARSKGVGAETHGPYRVRRKVRQVRRLQSIQYIHH
jgi:hypothetical protein